MRNFERVVTGYRNNELIAYFNTFYFELVMTTSLFKIECDVSQIFTLEIFREVKQEIEGAGALDVIKRIETEGNLMFQIYRFSKHGKDINFLCHET